VSFPEELLDLAYDLQRRGPEPNQAILRRAVSTAYYALFHLLIEAAVTNWVPERHRNVLARTFEHPRMKAACVGLTNRAKSGEMLPAELSVVARAFINLQEQRHRADYDNSTQWSSSGALEVLAEATEAFQTWKKIRDSEAAQDFLLLLFMPKPPR
jgi:uncharacterized protein (UPF0332 family)